MPNKGIYSTFLGGCKLTESQFFDSVLFDFNFVDSSGELNSYKINLHFKYRITAYAGKRPMAVHGKSCGRDHPRACGEKSSYRYLIQ